MSDTTPTPYARDACRVCADPLVDHDPLTGCVWCNCRIHDDKD